MASNWSLQFMFSTQHFVINIMIADILEASIFGL